MTTDRTPLPPERVDELLSAELDGELAAAAAELGLTLDGARAALDATPGVDERRAALAAARAALVADPLPAPRREAIVAAAIASARRDELAARRPRRHRSLALAGAAAAAAVVLVGLVAIAGGRRGPDTSTADAGSAATAATAAEELALDEGPDGGGEGAAAPAPQAAADAPVVSFGALDDLDRLASEVRARLDAPPAPPGPGAGDERVDGDTASSTSRAPLETACEVSLANGGTVVLRGDVDLAGRPASVVVFERPEGRTLVVVGTGCSVLATAPVDPRR